MTSATLQMTLADYNALLDARANAQKEAADLQEELRLAKLVDPMGAIVPLTAFARDCLTIARFAVANLPPETIRGWPYEALFRIIENIQILPDCSVNDRDMALDLDHFARDCRDHAIRRAAEPKARKMTAEDIEKDRQRMEADPVAQALINRMRVRG